MDSDLSRYWHSARKVHTQNKIVVVAAAACCLYQRRRKKQLHTHTHTHRTIEKPLNNHSTVSECKEPTSSTPEDNINQTCDIYLLDSNKKKTQIKIKITKQ